MFSSIAGLFLVHVLYNHGYVPCSPRDECCFMLVICNYMHHVTMTSCYARIRDVADTRSKDFHLCLHTVEGFTHRKPPSITTSTPLMYPPAGDTRAMTVPTISCGLGPPVRNISRHDRTIMGPLTFLVCGQVQERPPVRPSPPHLDLPRDVRTSAATRRRQALPRTLAPGPSSAQTRWRTSS